MSRLKLKQIQEILLSTLANGDFLAYNNSTGLWENNAAPLDGAKGQKGATGSKGTKGTQGLDGADGTDGSERRCGLRPDPSHAGNRGCQCRLGLDSPARKYAVFRGDRQPPV